MQRSHADWLKLAAVGTGQLTPNVNKWKDKMHKSRFTTKKYWAVLLSEGLTWPYTRATQIRLKILILFVIKLHFPRLVVDLFLK